MNDPEIKPPVEATPFSIDVPQLLQSHLSHLKSSSLSLEVIRERCYESVLGRKRLTDLGFSKAQCSTPGILIPIYSPGGENNRCQYRPDRPRTNTKGKAIKYETPQGSGLCIDVPRRCQADIGNPNVPLFVTEGIKKGDALATKGACAIALLGVWGFVGRNPQGGVTVLPDWRYIALSNRRVFIAYDSDVVLKRPVQQALDTLAGLLERKGADVYAIFLSSENGSKVGIDDFLLKHSLDEAIRLAQKLERGLKLRCGYRVEDGHICRVTIERSGMESVIPLCNFTAEINEDITRDDGVEKTRFFIIDGKLANGCNLPSVQVSASAFSSLSWVISNWGVGAVIAAGQSAKDQLREAIQVMSTNPNKRVIYTHTGWVKIADQWSFLSNNAINADVELPEGLRLYHLPERCDSPKESIKHSLKILEIGPSEITVPLLAAVYTAPLSEVLPAGLMLFLLGVTGNLKTTLASLALSHYGGPFDRKNVPASLISTDNYLERLSSQAKDVLLLIDDFFPQPSEREARQQEQKLQRLIRSQSAHGGKGRLRADASMRPTYSPRGLLLVTGEMLPTGQSTAARMFTVEIDRNKIDLEVLSQLQREVAYYPEAMRSYLDWLAPKIDKLRSELPDEFAEIREIVRRKSAHLNVAEMVAQLTIGWNLMLEHAEAVGAIGKQKRDRLIKEGFDVLISLGEVQQSRIAGERIGERSIDILKNLMAQKRGYLRDKASGEAPEDYESLGWERRETTEGTYKPHLLPGAELLGWIDEDFVYLLSEASYKAVARFARDQGAPITISKKGLHMNLKDEGILLPVDGRIIITKKIAGGTHRVIRIDISAFD